MLGSRRRKLGAALGVLLLLGVGGLLVFLHLTTGESARSASWQLLGVSADGRALTIREPDHGACERVESQVDDHHDDRIEVSVKLLEPRGGYDCILMLLAGDEVSLPLDRPVEGRRIVGEKKRLQPPYRVDMHGRSARTTLKTRPRAVPAEPPPRVVGLRYPDARDALCNAGFQATTSRATRSNGTVVAQLPPTRQRRTGRPRLLKCTNGLLPAVLLQVNP